MDTFDFNVEDRLRPSAERKLTGTTRLDTEISSAPVPKGPIAIKVSVMLLRLYRKLAPKALRCRCVFDPSCSHYSELAIRQYGLFKGAKLTFYRLSRCKPGAGGIDFQHINKGK
jgi:putative membrane protein insertion efficiency factor